MPVVIPTSADVQRAFRSALLLPQVKQSDDGKTEFARYLRGVVTTHWQSIGAGVEVLDVDDRVRLVKIAFRHIVEKGKTDGASRLKQTTTELAAMVRAAIPPSALAHITAERCAEAQVLLGTQFECLAQGVVFLTVPVDVLFFLRSKGVEAMSGEFAGHGTLDMVAAEHLKDHIDDHEMWEVVVRSPGNPTTKPWPVKVERPKRTGLPMKATGLDGV